LGFELLSTQYCERLNYHRAANERLLGEPRQTLTLVLRFLRSLAAQMWRCVKQHRCRAAVADLLSELPATSILVSSNRCKHAALAAAPQVLESRLVPATLERQWLLHRRHPSLHGTSCAIAQQDSAQCLQKTRLPAQGCTSPMPPRPWKNCPRGRRCQLQVSGQHSETRHRTALVWLISQAHAQNYLQGSVTL